MTEGKDIECAAVQMLTTGDTEMQELKELHYNSSIALRSSAKRAEMRVCLKGAKHFRYPPLAEGGLLSRIGRASAPSCGRRAGWPIRMQTHVLTHTRTSCLYLDFSSVTAQVQPQGSSGICTST